MNQDNLPEIVLGIIKQNGKVLIIQRAKEEKGSGDVKLSWAFPGGKVEEGETKEQAVERELLEETGYEVEVKDVISERQHPQFPVYVYYIECKLKSDHPVQQPQDEEIKEVKWAKISELTNYFTTNLDPKVAEYLKINTYNGN